MSKQLDTILNKPVNLRGLIENISFNPDQLEDAALEQPGLYLEASRYRTLKMRKSKSRELQLDLVRAELGLQYRKKRQTGDKMTEAAIKEAVMLEPEMTDAQKALNKAEEEEEFAKGLVEVFRQRLHVLNILKDIRISEAPNVVKRVRNEMAVGQMRKAAEKARERFDESKGEDL